uniref:Serine aminopeptidase S33 domain-containing protein n=1 Tax=Tetradesmus obliquus TaxID=3088 RepID=A0A383W7U6_TETOB|eukprot:jgi/Sobl393_1/2632/SZX73064.1
MITSRVLTYLVVAVAGLVVLPWDTDVIPGPLPRDASQTEADAPQNAATYTREVIYFPCSGERCQAWLYMPKQGLAPGRKPPIVIAAHGLGAQKDFGLAAYGERFAAGGLASLIFDYRTFGGSDGEPRHWVSPKRHLQDWQSAFDFAVSQLGGKVDTSKVLLWGTSFGGGHALTTAANLRDNITAVVAQVPFTDGKAAFAKNVKERGYPRIARAVIAALHDMLRSAINMPAAYYPLIGEPGMTNFMGLTQDEQEAYYAKHPAKKQGGWRNLGRCRLALEASAYRPIALLPQITAPVLFAAATKDQLCPLDGVKAAVAVTPNAQLVTVDTNHFQVYSGEALEYLSEKYVEFFRQAAGLPAQVAASSSNEEQPQDVE